MEDDLEYFISFPTPKPYIESLNKKFNSESPNKQYLDNLPSIDSSLKKDINGHTAINLSSIPSATTLTTNSNSSDSSKESLDESSLDSLNLSSASEGSGQHAHDDLTLGIHLEVGSKYTTTTKDKNYDHESNQDENLLFGDDSTLPYFK